MGKFKGNYPKMQEIEVLYKQGKKASEIGQLLGLDAVYVDYIVFKKLGLRSEKKKNLGQLSKDITDRIIFLYKWGYNPEEILEDLNVRKSDVEKTIKQAGKIDRIAG